MDRSVPVIAKKLHGLKGAAIILLAAIFTFALGWPHALVPVWAQMPAQNPLIAPVPPPAAPTQLPAPVTTAIAPQLAPVPTPPQASPTPSERAFNCSCFGGGTGTHWMGQVTAPGYFGARQSAVRACLSYNLNRAPQSPFVVPRQLGAGPVPVLPGAQPPASATQSAPTLPGTLNFSTAEQLQMCSNCTCD